MNILIVDDDQVLARSTAKLLRFALQSSEGSLGDHHVTITDSPAELFHQCQTERVDIVLLDVNLPGAAWRSRSVSGADLARILKSEAQTTHIPIILLTAYALASERQTLLQTSLADDLFTKPITDYEFLLERIKGLVYQRR